MAERFEAWKKRREQERGNAGGGFKRSRDGGRTGRGWN